MEEKKKVVRRPIRDLNPWPSDKKSDALPTELTGLILTPRIALDFPRKDYTQSNMNFKKWPWKTFGGEHRAFSTKTAVEWNLSTPFSLHNRAAMCELRN